MNIKNTTSLLAFAVLMGTTGVVFAGGSSTFDAAVSVLSPDQTGFIIGGQVSVNGLGSGSVVLSRSAAQMAVNGNASSLLDPVSVGSAYLNGVTSTSDITSSLNFARNIATAGSLVGQGSVLARGEAIASMGTAGAATAGTTTAGTREDAGVDASFVAGGEGSASAESSSQGSLNGSLSTANTLQLLGTSGLFAGSNSLDVGETNQAIAYGSSNVAADGTSGIDLTTAAASGTGLQTATGNGALFSMTSSLTNAAGATSDIDLSVSNAGNGTVSLTASTGGFFTGGGAAGGSATFVDNGSFFNPTVTTVTGPVN